MRTWGFGSSLSSTLVLEQPKAAFLGHITPDLQIDMAKRVAGDWLVEWLEVQDGLSV